jgi:CRISPR-associated protein Csy2
MRNFLLIPHLKILNANAMSSPYSIGFPAMTAWLGGVHALQRYLNQNGFEKLKLSSVAVSCHDLNLQTYKGFGDYVHSIKATANPLDKDGNRPAFIEEARSHLEVSLLIEFSGVNASDVRDSKELIENQLRKMKFAGGDILSFGKVDVIANVNEDDPKEVRRLKRRLMLGSVLIERRDLMKKSMQEENKDALDALLDHLKIMHRCSKDEDNVLWTSKKKEAGWLVPISIGFQGISDLGKVKNQRDPNVLHRFAESVVTLGEFVMPYKVKKLNDMMWQYRDDLEKNLYLCQTIQQIKE